MSRFTLAWLRQRVPFDLAARDTALARRFAAAVARDGDHPARLIDLGAGAGANARALAPVIGGDQEWLLIDDDPALLEAQAAEHLAWATRAGWAVARADNSVVIHAGDARWRFVARRLNLARHGMLDTIGRCDGVTMAALADLVAAAWIDALVAQLARRRVPLLSVLAVDGRRDWHPPSPEDALIRGAFARHQRGEKGFGPALGADASAYLAARLSGAGYAVSTAPSNWRVGGEACDMLAAIVAGEARAAGEMQPDAAATIAAWHERRKAELTAGALSLLVGHRDVLGLPGDA
ncbi:MAG TPA: class I SAM-dependent methyltransferase [Stellaceae bacterium]|nr:class I SAM-dependent methyltransferase [Stellaceae bacterium]